MIWFIIVYIKLCPVIVLCFKKPDVPCKIDNIKCLTDQGQDALITAVFGDKDNEIESLDPMEQTLIETYLPGIRLKLRDSTVTGLKDAKITEMKMSQKSTILIDFWVPLYVMNGHYEIDCDLLSVPSYSKGWYSINATNIDILIDVGYKMYEKDNKGYINLTSFNTITKQQRNMQWGVNFFNENNNQDEPGLNYLNDNSKLVEELWNKPIVAAIVNIFSNNFNKVIERFPFDVMIKM